MYGLAFGRLPDCQTIHRRKEGGCVSPLLYDCDGGEGHLKPRCEGLGPFDTGLSILPLRAALAARLAAFALGETTRAGGVL